MSFSSTNDAIDVRDWDWKSCCTHEVHDQRMKKNNTSNVADNPYGKWVKRKANSILEKKNEYWEMRFFFIQCFQRSAWIEFIMRRHFWLCSVKIFDCIVLVMNDDGGMMGGFFAQTLGYENISFEFNDILIKQMGRLLFASSHSLRYVNSVVMRRIRTSNIDLLRWINYMWKSMMCHFINILIWLR